MPNRPAGFDPSILDALLDLGARQHQLDEFRQRAEDRRGAVTPVVYDRVMNDYQARLAALKAEAAPLEQRVRVEYQKLHGVIDDLRNRLATARLDQEELEFRRQVGEIDEAEFTNMVGPAAGIIAETETELARLEAQAARFVEALGNDEHPRGVFDRPQPALPRQAAEREQPTATMGRELPRVGGEAIANAAPHATDPEHTLPRPDARLVLDEDGGTIEFPLSLLNYVGRSEGNQVQLARAGVSRRHAMIRIGPDGRYTIQDLQSLNGTFVNGERISDAILADGDRIVIGEVELTFHAHVLWR